MLQNIFKKLIRKAFPPNGKKLLAERLSKKLNLGYIHEQEAFEVMQVVKHNTMLPYEQLVSVYEQVIYCEQNKIPGALVECGVWKGGASGMMAAASKKHSTNIRNLYLFDAFDDICEPDSQHDDKQLVDEIKKITKTDKATYAGALKPLSGIYNEWGGYGTLSEVKELIQHKIHYPAENTFYIKGWFQETMPEWKNKINDIALLRLDGDWYESTKVCLEVLYPKLSKGGVCIIDDYGYNSGCRKAVHEYLEREGQNPLMARIDYLRYWIKP